MGDYFGDVMFDVWNRGGNPDLVDRDRVAERELDGVSTDDCASAELRAQRRRHHYEDERERYEDDGREYADPRDFREGLE